MYYLRTLRTRHPGTTTLIDFTLAWFAGQALGSLLWKAVTLLHQAPLQMFYPV
jgi:hypothetical protein